MKFSYSFPLDVPASAVWTGLQDAQRLIGCLPGCEAVEPEGPDQFQVRLSTGLGPVRLQVGGKARLRYDAERQSISADVTLSDGRAGAIYGTFILTAHDRTPAGSAIQMEADVNLSGKLGEFAQPLLRRKADQTVRQFADKLSAQVGLGAV